MKKRVIIGVAITIAVLIGIIFLIHAIAPKTYTMAKKESERFLKYNYDEMAKIAVNLLTEGKSDSGHYKERYFSYEPKSDFVKFEIDAQGMLGGQYWSLVYTKDGMYCGETEEYLYEETGGGNNIIRCEKIDDHWWFCWIDYDGTDKSYK